MARIRVHSRQIPNFVRDHPVLLTASYQGRRLLAWDIGFTQYGVPIEWTPRFEAATLSGREGDVSVIAYSSGTAVNQACRRVVEVKDNRVRISSDTLRTLQLLFGFRSLP